jgi:hypothetical protein
MKNIDNILFLLSQPRSGSTFLQLLLNSNNGISSSPESSLLLKYIYNYKYNDSISFDTTYYNHAVDEFIDSNKKKVIDTELENFIFKLFSSFSEEDCQYYLDKSPRYYHIIDELITTFGNAKFIILLRNPFAVLSSIINYHYNNVLTKPLSTFSCYDLFSCLQKFDHYWTHRNDYKNIIFIKYENLIEDTTGITNSIESFLSISSKTGTISSINESTRSSSFVDPNAKIHNYPYRDSLDKWIKNINTYQQKNIFLFYYSFLKKLRIVTDNYELDNFLDKIKSKSVSYKPYYLRTNKFFENSFQFL